MKKLYFLLVMLVSIVSVQAQNIEGRILDGNTGDALIGASVIVKGTSIGTITDIDGSFTIAQPDMSAYDLMISYVGYKTMTLAVTGGSSNLGNISMEADAIGLNEIVVSGTIDLVRDRQTPVAATSIRAREIQLKLGNQEFPEIMKTTPSVYATKTGGGYGDGRISIRGFDNTNVAVIINGQPVNDMENGRVFWSNWAGLQDMASGVEIQRGLGASNLAVPSVGGTINVITKSTMSQQGGYLLGAVGNDGYLKTTVGYNTGVLDNGWSASAMIGRWQGNGYINGTDGEGYNYLFALGHQFNEHHSVNASYLGAGQWHHQRTSWTSIRDYQNFGEADKDGINRKLNIDSGTRGGDDYNFRRNFYNKPIASINWDYNISDNMRLYTTAYGSWGRGGGTGSRGRNFNIAPFRKDLTAALEDGSVSQDYRNADGTINFDAVIANNQSGTPYAGDLGDFEGQIIGTNTGGLDNETINTNIAIRRSSINSHNWYGAISNFEVDVDKFTFGVGLDARKYTGLHYRVLNDLLGLDGYYSTGNDFSQGKVVTAASEANPFSNITETEKINYYNIGEVGWIGVNGLAEYKSGDLSAVVQGGISNQSYLRKDYFAQLPNVSDEHSITGGYIKGGANYNINHQHNVFFNAGFIARQPFFDAVFPSFGNTINEDVDTENITSFELGYGLRSNYIDAKVNLYSTIWTNRFLSTGVQLDGGIEGTAVYSGLENQHNGLEIELTGKPTDDLKIKGMVSIGDWTYSGETNADVFDDNQEKVGEQTLYIDGVKVGDVAQTSISLGADYTILDGFSVDATYLFYDNLYADFSVIDDGFFDEENAGALKLPSYGLLDLGATYSLPVGKNELLFRINVYNVLDELYIAESNTNIHEVGEGFSNFQGLSNENSVWFGFGRTWSGSVRYNF